MNKFDFSNVDKDKINKRVKPILNKYKRQKRQATIKWFQENWIGLTTLLFTVLAFMTSVISIIVQILKQ